MTIIEGILDLQKYDFTDTSFNLLMQKRIHRVLVICSNYDNYMLEEDGRIDEQIFNEYASLSLRYPPTFVQTDNAICVKFVTTPAIRNANALPNAPVCR